MQLGKKLRLCAISAAIAVSLNSASFAQNAAGTYLAARQAAFDSNFKEASKYYLRAIAANPDNPMILENGMVALIASGDIQNAIEVAQKLQSQGFSSEFTRLVLTAQKFSNGEFADVELPGSETSDLERLIGGLAKAWADIGTGQMSDALNAFETLASEDDFASFIRYHQALAFALVGDFEETQAILSGEKYGELVLTVRGIEAQAKSLIQLGRDADALALIDSSLAARYSAQLEALRERIADGEAIDYDFVTLPAEGLAEVYFTFASLLEGRASAENTLVYARLADFLTGNQHVAAKILIAEELDRVAQYDLAVEAYASIPTDDPAFFPAELGRASTLFAADKRDAAIEALKNLAKSHPEAPLVYASLGDFEGRERNDDAAVEAYSTAIDLLGPQNPQSWRIHYARGIVHERNKRFDAMEEDFRQALVYSPENPDVLNYLGYSLVEQRIKLDEALEMIKTAVERRPDSGYITDSLGWIFYRLERFEEAVEPMERAVELLPVDPIVNDHLGDVYWMVGRFREAEFQWKRALSFEPIEKEEERIRRKLAVGLDAVLKEEEEAEVSQNASD